VPAGGSGTSGLVTLLMLVIGSAPRWPSELSSRRCRLKALWPEIPPG
jgi:hypothetical protein